MKSIDQVDSPALKSVKQQFEQWRNTRGSRREPIPQPLWQAAVELCSTHSITKVSRSLRLSYAKLKKRMPSAPCPTTDIQFMELSAGSLAGQWHMECDRPDGAKLRMTGNGQFSDVENLLGVFLS